MIAGKFHFDNVELYIENKKYREVIKILMEIIERYNKLATRSRGDEA